MPDRPARPLSPHLSIYRPQITSVLSILHRLAGLALLAGAAALVWALAAAAAGPGPFAAVEAFFAAWWGRGLLLAFTLAFFFHLLNGVRHLFWDAGFGFELPAVRASGWTVALLTPALTALSWWLALGGPGA